MCFPQMPSPIAIYCSDNNMVPVHEVDALARILLPKIQAFFESEEGQREYAEWKARHQAEQENKT